MAVLAQSDVLLERDAQLRLFGPAPVTGAGAPVVVSATPGSLAMHARPATQALLPSQLFPTLNGSDSVHWVTGHRIYGEFQNHVQRKFAPVTALFHAKWALVMFSKSVPRMGPAHQTLHSGCMIWVWLILTKTGRWRGSLAGRRRF